MNILTALKTTLTAFPQVERRIALAQFLSRFINTKIRITNYRCIGKDADAIDMFLRNVGMDESVYTIDRSKFDNDTALIRWNTENQKKVSALLENISRAITVNSLTRLYSGIVLESNEECVAQDVVDTENLTNEEHWSKSIQEVTESIIGEGVYTHFATLGEIECYAWAHDLIDSSVKLPPVPLFFTEKDTSAGNDVAVRYMMDTDTLKFMPGLTSAPIRSLLASTSEYNPLTNFLYQTKDALLGVNDLHARKHLLVTTTGWVNTTNRLYTMQIIEFISNPKDLWAYISMLFRVVYKVHCTVTPWSRVAVNNFRTQNSPDIYPTELKNNGDTYQIHVDVDGIESSTHLAVLVSVILTPQSAEGGNTPVPGYTNVQDITPIPLISEETSQSTGETSGAVDNRTLLDKRDLGGEWFALVHGLDMSNVTETPEERVERFRTMYSEFNLTDYTKRPSILEVGSSNPVQVFVGGCAIAVRKLFRTVNRDIVFHDSALAMLTDMYSGIMTDGSPTTEQYSSGAEAAFPFMGTSLQANSTFFKSLDTGDGSKVQLRVAPREDVSTPRMYSIILKTTLDAESFMDAWAVASEESKKVVYRTVGMSFLNAYVYRGKDSTAAAGLGTPLSTHTIQMLKDLLGEFDLPYPCPAASTVLPKAKVLAPAQLLDFHSIENYSAAEMTRVRFMSDLDNRLYIEVQVPLSFAVSARLVYRANNGLPIATHMLARKLQAISKYNSSRFTAHVPTSEVDPKLYYDKYIAAIMEDKRLHVPGFSTDAVQAFMSYPSSNIGSTPETSILMNVWGTMYSKKFLSADAVNTYPGTDRKYLDRGDFCDIADSEMYRRDLKVKDIVFGTVES